MQWITGLQQAVDYIEDHLTETLSYPEIARQAYSSNYHFQRVFGILCGYSLGEYIRNRRLTLAGGELAASGCKVIDIALKYGYDNPESFSRAFTKFHGVTPSEAKTGRAALKMFSRLSVQLILQGGTEMHYRLEQPGAFRIMAHKERFPSTGEISKPQIQTLWQRLQKDGTISTLCRYADPHGIFGDCMIGVSADLPDHASFDYAVGVACAQETAADGLSLLEIPARTWAVFPCKGAMPDAFEALYKRIYSEFFPTSAYQPAGDFAFEVYPSDQVDSPDYTCEFWISVEAK